MTNGSALSKMLNNERDPLTGKEEAWEGHTERERENGVGRGQVRASVAFPRRRPIILGQSTFFARRKVPSSSPDTSIYRVQVLASPSTASQMETALV